ncbi:hypothetical protein AFL01nite_02780 [Aeromicrobium flavum]|uniref:Uncharacterized protein n=1 Tax=Aeromicrobium flavum TaxID=416568 RepID=A0A512HR79_9ACTN|nr:hypothetical protein [Aeromicrobium flavum]GEO87951.1 hypothetical protein AFL01nite_02780 [Aeromicrobium flavum]
MPTFHDPVADAEEAYEALRALAHQTAVMEDPRQIYQLLGSLSAAVAALGQTLHQIARTHDVPDHDRLHGRSQVGVRHEVSWELHRAGEIMSHVAGCIDRAHEAESQIIYKPPTPAVPSSPTEEASRPGFGL